MRFAGQGVELAYDDIGEASGATVVLLHGLGSARSTWDAMAPKLARRHRVLTVDQRGHGDSSHAPGTYTLEHYVPDAVEFCETVVGRPAALVGHSLGGVVAASVAQTRPDLVRCLLLEDPPMQLGARQRSVAGGIDSAAADADAPEESFRAIFSLLYEVVSAMQARRAPLEEYEAVLHVAPSPNGAGSFAAVLGDEGTRARARGLASLDPGVFLAAIDGSGLAAFEREAPVACPVRVLRADPALGSAFTDDDDARFRSLNPGAEVVVVSGASHFIHDEMPGDYLGHVEALLEAR